MSRGFFSRSTITEEETVVKMKMGGHEYSHPSVP